MGIPSKLACVALSPEQLRGALWTVDVEHEVDGCVTEAMHVVGLVHDARHLLELTHHYATGFSGHACIKAFARNDEWTCTVRQPFHAMVPVRPGECGSR